MVLDYIAPASAPGQSDKASASAQQDAPPTDAPSLENLPMDALECILVHLSLRDRLRAASVSRALRELIHASATVWASLESADLPDTATFCHLCALAGPRLRRVALRTVEPVLVRVTLPRQHCQRTFPSQ